MHYNLSHFSSYSIKFCLCQIKILYIILLLLKAYYWNPVRPQRVETLNIFSTTNMSNSDTVGKLGFLNQITRFKHAPSPPHPPQNLVFMQTVYLCILNDFQNKQRLLSVNIIHLSAFVIEMKWAFREL